MKHIITALSGLIALVVFVYCMWIGADLETILFKTVMMFIATNLIAFAALGVTTVTMNTNEEPEEDDDLLSELDTTNSNPETQAAVNA